MKDFALYDTRHYPVRPVREGYSGWAASYDSAVLDLMDLKLAGRLQSVRWAEAREALDLACGTGRLGAWLRGQGVAAVDGVDLTPAMLEGARARGDYRDLRLGEVTALDAEEEAYDLITQSLADEHLPDLRPLYAEAARVARPGGAFVLIGYHPWFLMSGMAAHYEETPGRPVAIESYVHLFSDHVAAALAHGWRLAELQEALVDDEWIAAKPKWAGYRDRPISFAFAWRK